MPITGWIISSIVAAVVGAAYVATTATMNKKVVRNQLGEIDFTKSDLYFYWSRWDYALIFMAIYTFLCITGLLVFLLRGDTINNPLIQFFIHQTFVFTLITFLSFIVRLAYVFKGIKKRWPDEFKS